MGQTDFFAGDSIRINSQCYKFKGEPIGSTLMDEVKQAFADTAEIMKDVEAIIKSGCSSLREVAKTYAKLKAAKAGGMVGR